MVNNVNIRVNGKLLKEYSKKELKQIYQDLKRLSNKEFNNKQQKKYIAKVLRIVKIRLSKFI